MNTKKKTNYPDFAERYHTKGTSIKKIRDNYYLYKVTSHYVKGKGYPVSEQTYIGRIDEEKGLIRSTSVSFTPGKDEILLFSDVFSLSAYSESEKKLLENIPVLCIGKTFYTGKLDKKIISLIAKNYSYDEGVISL